MSLIIADARRTRACINDRIRAVQISNGDKSESEEECLREQIYVPRQIVLFTAMMTENALSYVIQVKALR